MVEGLLRCALRRTTGTLTTSVGGAVGAGGCVVSYNYWMVPLACAAHAARRGPSLMDVVVGIVVPLLGAAVMVLSDVPFAAWARYHRRSVWSTGTRGLAPMLQKV